MWQSAPEVLSPASRHGRRPGGGSDLLTWPSSSPLEGDSEGQWPASEAQQHLSRLSHVCLCTIIVINCDRESCSGQRLLNLPERADPLLDRLLELHERGFAVK